MKRVPVEYVARYDYSFYMALVGKCLYARCYKRNHKTKFCPIHSMKAYKRFQREGIIFFRKFGVNPETAFKDYETVNYSIK